LKRGALLAALFLAALTLRPQLVGVGPLIPSIQDDLHSSHAVVGLLGAIPVLCMGLFAPPAAFLSRRFGSRHALAAALALIGVFGLARAFAPGVVLLILLTFPVGIGMGLGNALLPVAVKERFAERPVFATGVYAAGINVGATSSAASAVALERRSSRCGSCSRARSAATAPRPRRARWRCRGEAPSAGSSWPRSSSCPPRTTASTPGSRTSTSSAAGARPARERCWRS
jgi:cyanate permease